MLSELILNPQEYPHHRACDALWGKECDCEMQDLSTEVVALEEQVAGAQEALETIGETWDMVIAKRDGNVSKIAALEAELASERSMRHEAQSDYGNQMERLEAAEEEANRRRQEFEVSVGRIIALEARVQRLTEALETRLPDVPHFYDSNFEDRWDKFITEINDWRRKQLEALDA